MVPQSVSFQKLNHPNFLSMQKPNVGPINPTFPVLMSYNLSSQISQIKNLPNQRGSRGGRGYAAKRLSGSVQTDPA